MAQISEELDEDESMVVSHDSSQKSKDLSKTMKENRTGSLANSMKELSTPKLNQTDDFMKQIEDVENELPTMEDLAGTSLVKQIEAQEDKEEARVSNRNRMGASLLAQAEEEEKKAEAAKAQAKKDSTRIQSTGDVNKHKSAARASGIRGSKRRSNARASKRVSKGSSVAKSSRDSTVDFMSNRDSFFDDSDGYSDDDSVM